MTKRKFLFCGFTIILCLYLLHLNYFVEQKTRNLLRKLPLQNAHLFKHYLTPTACTGGVPRVVILVTSYVSHVELRSAHRRAMPLHYLHALNTTRIFLLAHIPASEKFITQKEIESESDRFQDILQGSFVEHYRNLTYKHLMGLSWAGSHCGHSKYIIKVDDDTVFDYETIHGLLGEHDPSEELMLGYVLNGTRPHRERANKWYVSSAEYPHPEYPPYVSGWLYVTTPATATALVNAAAYHSYFWIDDIFITGILTSALNIKIKDLRSKNIWLEYYELMECCLRDMVERNVKCEYAVAPNGGRNNLILEFNDALWKCKTSIHCKIRSDLRSLKETCVVQGQRTLFGKGQSQVQVVHL